jgi:hypothetical protein
MYVDFQHTLRLDRKSRNGDEAMSQDTAREVAKGIIAVCSICGGPYPRQPSHALALVDARKAEAEWWDFRLKRGDGPTTETLARLAALDREREGLAGKP